jgi:SAM-dependent methyltransferase
MLVQEAHELLEVPTWGAYLERYRRGEWRGTVFRDMMMADARRLGDGLTILDIGCGKGIDGNHRLQRAVADEAGRYVGVEPDPAVPLGGWFTEAHRCAFEDAPLEPGSVHLAFAVMVMEHLADPGRFWDKLHEVLADGGVFWGLTMDARHWFCRASRWSDRLRVKDWYLNRLHGERGTDRYENYPVCYRSNRPDDIARQAGRFRSCQVFGLARVGQMDYYLPRFARRVGRWLDRRAIRRGKPGMLLAVRVQK